MKLLTQEFDHVGFAQILKSQNRRVDKLVKQSSSEVEQTNIDLNIEVQKRPSIEEVLTLYLSCYNLHQNLYHHSP